jgi:hypothetical protein
MTIFRWLHPVNGIGARPTGSSEASTYGTGRGHHLRRILTDMALMGNPLPQGLPTTAMRKWRRRANATYQLVTIEPREMIPRDCETTIWLSVADSRERHG